MGSAAGRSTQPQPQPQPFPFSAVRCAALQRPHSLDPSRPHDNDSKREGKGKGSAARCVKRQRQRHVNVARRPTRPLIHRRTSRCAAADGRRSGARSNRAARTTAKMPVAQQRADRALVAVRTIRVIAAQRGDGTAAATAAAAAFPSLVASPPRKPPTLPPRCHSLGEVDACAQRRRYGHSDSDSGSSGGRRTAGPLLLLPLLCLALLLLSASTPLLLRTSASVYNCSASAGDCIRIGLFYCANVTGSVGPSAATPPASFLPVTACAGIRGYNLMLDWYRTRVHSQLDGRIVGVPVHFVTLTLPAHSPSKAELAALVNQTFFTNSSSDIADTQADSDGRGNSSRALVDFVILPPGAGWDEAMLRLERAQIPAISAHAPLASQFQCAGASTNLHTLQPPCVAPNTRRFEYAHGLASTADQYLLSWVSLLGLRKVSTLAVVVATDADAAAHPLGVASPRGMRAKMLQPMRVGVLQAARENHIRILANEGIMLRTASYAHGSAASRNQTLLDRDARTIAAVVARIATLAPQALALITMDCAPWLAALRQANFAPAATAATFCVREQDRTPPSRSAGSGSGDRAGTGGSSQRARRPHPSMADTLYVVDAMQWSPRTRGHEVTEVRDDSPWALFPHVSAGNTTVLSSPRQFQLMWQGLMHAADTDGSGSGGETPSWNEAAVLGSLSMLEGAISLSVSEMRDKGGGSGPGIAPALVNRQLQLYFQPSFLGWLTTNRFGFNQQKALVMLQRAPGPEYVSTSSSFSATDRGPRWASASTVVEIVAPQSAAGMDWIYPAPSWADRTYTPRILGRFTVEWVVLALLCVCAAATMGLLMALARYRAFFAHSQRFDPHTALHSRFFLVVGLGCLVGYAAPLVWNVDNDERMCAARAWLWPLAVHLVADPLVSACICITRASATSRAPLGKQPRWMDRASLSQRICAGAVLLALPQLLFNLIWVVGFGGLSPRIVSVDPLRASASFTACACSSFGCDVMVAVSVAYGVLLLVIGVVYAWRTRKSAAMGMFQDAHAISLSLALFALTATVVLAVQVALSMSSVDAFAHAVLHGLRSCGALVAFQGCFVVLVLRRLLDGMALAGGVGGGGGRATAAVGAGTRAKPNAAAAAGVGERRAQERVQPGANGHGMQIGTRNSDALHHRVGLPSHALKSRASATTLRAAAAAGGAANGAGTGTAAVAGPHGDSARSPSVALHGSRTIGTGGAPALTHTGHLGALSMAVGMITPSTTGRELGSGAGGHGHDRGSGESVFSAVGSGFPDVFSRAGVPAGPLMPAPGVEMGPLGTGAMVLDSGDVQIPNGVEQGPAAAVAGGGANGMRGGGSFGVAHASGAALGRLVVPPPMGASRPSISVIAESPSPGHAPLDMTPSPSPPFLVGTRRGRSSLSPSGASDHFGSEGDSSGANSARPRLASVLLPADCALPDSSATAALDLVSLVHWRQQIAMHAEQIELLVPAKEAEQQRSRIRAVPATASSSPPDADGQCDESLRVICCESDGSDPRHLLSPQRHRRNPSQGEYASTRMGAAAVLAPYSSSRESAPTSHTTSPRYASPGPSALPSSSSLQSDLGNAKSRGSLPSLRSNRSSTGTSSGSSHTHTNSSGVGTGTIASPLALSVSPLLCASPSNAAVGAVVARPSSTSASASSRPRSASRVAQAPDDAAALTAAAHFDLTAMPDGLPPPEPTLLQCQPGAIASAVSMAQRPQA